MTISCNDCVWHYLLSLHCKSMLHWWVFSATVGGFLNLCHGKWGNKCSMTNIHQIRHINIIFVTVKLSNIPISWDMGMTVTRELSYENANPWGLSYKILHEYEKLGLDQQCLHFSFHWLGNNVLYIVLARYQKVGKTKLKSQGTQQKNSFYTISK